jgi:hypothetical protein
VKEIHEKIKKGELIDSKTLAALLLARNYLNE